MGKYSQLMRQSQAGYAPAEGRAVFHGKSGFFCGVLARVDGELHLVLTERGEQVLLLSE